MEELLELWPTSQAGVPRCSSGLGLLVASSPPPDLTPSSLTLIDEPVFHSFFTFTSFLFTCIFRRCTQVNQSEGCRCCSRFLFDIPVEAAGPRSGGASPRTVCQKSEEAMRSKALGSLISSG